MADWYLPSGTVIRAALPFAGVSVPSSFILARLPLPLTVRITAANRDTEEKETKIVEVIYIGSALSVPAQFPAHTYKQLEAVVLTDGKAVSLRSSVKK
ncbi:hypothetical protein [Treponema medium]|uniref:hypothetical protein n=1 Tax=Treponema medium TaxID=58231 RepID=UPI00209132A4|nr:hypothetical protein [Treponema medium]